MFREIKKEDEKHQLATVTGEEFARELKELLRKHNIISMVPNGPNSIIGSRSKVVIRDFTIRFSKKFGKS